jgi:hypothetical protein
MAQFFKNGPAIQSLRESDFDAVSAYGEVVDNSLQARASQIRVRVATRDLRRGYAQIEHIAFGDDGVGMDAETLENCLTIGWSSRYNERDGIGRFGVGMTMAAIHECKRVEIWSRQSGGPWLWTYIDLDEIETETQTFVPAPQRRDLPNEFLSLVGADSGTLVLWNKYDRQHESATSIINEFRVWAGRTYRYYIWDVIPPRTEPAVITIDGEVVSALGPLYARTEFTRFPQDPAAAVYEDIQVSWPVDQTVADEQEQESNVTIRLSILPEEFRAKRGSGGDAYARERYIDRNEGLSILRNYREVFYGEIPFWKGGKKGWPTFEEIDRWWGCEVLFEPKLDRAFQVKNIKRGAVPTRELKQLIKSKILPTRSTVLAQVRELWDKTDQEKRQAEAELSEEDGLKRSGSHGTAEETAKKTPSDRTMIDAAKDISSGTQREADLYKDQYDKEQRSKLAELFRSQPFTIMDSTWKGPAFFESSFLGGSAVLSYNLSHGFFQKIHGLIGQLDEEEHDSGAIARELRVSLDLLIIAYAKGEASFSPESEFTAEQFLDLLRGSWGRYLDNYVKTREKELGEQEQ